MTRAELKTFVQSLGYGTDTATQQGDMLLRALQEIEGRRDWKWMEDFTLDAVTLSIGNHSIAYPSQVKRVLDVMLSEPGGVANYYYPLRRITWDRWASYDHTDRTNSVPRYYTTSGSNIYVYPRPDKAYPASLRTIRNTVSTAFDADGESPPFDERFHIVLAWRTAQWIATRQRDWPAVDRYAAEYEKMVREMEQKDNSDKVSDHIVHSDYWDNVKPWLAR